MAEPTSPLVYVSIAAVVSLSVFFEVDEVELVLPVELDPPDEVDPPVVPEPLVDAVPPDVVVPPVVPEPPVVPDPLVVPEEPVAAELDPEPEPLPLLDGAFSSLSTVCFLTNTTDSMSRVICRSSVREIC